MLLVLLGQPLDELGTQRGMLSVIGADFALERFDRPAFGSEGSVIPAFNGRAPKDDPVSRQGMTPLFDSQFVELGLKLATVGRRGQKRANDAEPKMRPALMGPEG